jgi:hypothetical protein
LNPSQAHHCATGRQDEYKVQHAEHGAEKMEELKRMREAIARGEFLLLESDVGV